MTTFKRRDTGGRIDRSKTIAFTYDGARIYALAGDTLASALLANGKTIVARSFKYHRPRGFLSAGAEEPNGLFTIGEGARREPNIAGTTLPAADNMVVKSQNAWPSPTFDLMAVNSLAAPIFGAGFYYKTFMGPFKKSWMFYEPFIRRAAGIGAGVPDKDSARYDTSYGFCDVLVIGAGPAGLAAALSAGRAGAQVILAEQDSDLGGALLAETSDTLERWRLATLDELRRLANVTILTRATVQGLYDGNQGAISQHRDNGQLLHIIRARTVIHAAGSTERPLVFAHNDRPGVMLAGAVKSLLNRYALAPATRAVVATNNDSAYTTAFALAEAGVAVTVAELRAAPAGDILAQAAALGIAIFPNTGIDGTVGDKQLRQVRLAGRHSVTIECEVLAMSGGWSPNVHLTSHGGVKPVFNAAINGFVPGPMAAGHFAAGAVLGHFGTLAALRDGETAARHALQYLDLKDEAAAIEPPAIREDRAYDVGPLPKLSDIAHPAKAFVDFQHDVTARDIIVANQEGYHSVEHLKRYTTLGMATDQGKTSNINAIALMADARGIAPEAAGTTTFRPPYTPLTVGALAGRNVGQHFRPTRRSPLHD
ncbi:MAG: 2Fe-2S iron-sulfur cluster-binding protein, partial [Hyphomicrobiales bacterium]